MRFVWVVFIVIGSWSLASSMTAKGLFPSGHGASPFAEAVIGIVLICYAAHRLKKDSAPPRISCTATKVKQALWKHQIQATTSHS